jgi:hypothetical protein
MRLIESLNKGLAKVKAERDRRAKIAESNAQARLKKARTKQAKEKVKLELQRKKLKIRREFMDEQAEIKREKEALARERKELGISTTSEKAKRGISFLYKTGIKFYSSVGKPTKSKKAPVKRKTVKRKTKR